MTPRIIYLVKRAEIEVTSRMAKALDTFEITPIQFSILYFIDITKGDLSSAQLSRRFSMTPQSMNELVQILERKKLVKKNVDRQHRRILRISLTARGTQLLTKCNAELDLLEEALLIELSVNEIGLLRDLLGKILHHAREAVDIAKS